MADSPTFRTIRQYLAPRWLTEGAGGLVGYALDLVKDAYVERVRLGHMARFPENGPNGETAPADALAAHGRDRRLVRGRTETDAQYAQRLTKWLDDRRTVGSPFALCQKIAEYVGGAGATVKTVDNSGNWFVRAANGTKTTYLQAGNWNWDGNAAQWARFWIIVHPNGVWTDTRTWGDGTTWGSSYQTDTIGTTATYDDVEAMRNIANDWKPLGTTCANIIIALDPNSFNPAGAAGPPLPDGTWGRWSKDTAGTQVEARLSTARYWDGKATTA